MQKLLHEDNILDLRPRSRYDLVREYFEAAEKAKKYTKVKEQLKDHLVRTFGTGEAVERDLKVSITSQTAEALDWDALKAYLKTQGKELSDFNLKQLRVTVSVKPFKAVE